MRWNSNVGDRTQSYGIAAIEGTLKSGGVKHPLGRAALGERDAHGLVTEGLLVADERYTRCPAG